MGMIGHNHASGLEVLTTEEKKKLTNAIKAINDSMTRIAGERELIKEAIGETAEELNLDKKLVRKLAKTYFNSSFEMEKEEYSTFEEFYAGLFEKE